MTPNPPLTELEIAQMAYQVGDSVKIVNMRGPTDFCLCPVTKGLTNDHR